MNILFSCRTIRTKMIVHIAKALKNAGHLTQANAFVAYYDEWRDYLKNQKHVKFNKIIGTREIYQRMAKLHLDLDEINRIEIKYGSLDRELWNMIYCEPYIALHTHPRIYNHPKYTREDILLYLQATFKTFEELFEDIKPDAIIDFAHVNIVRGVLDLVAQKHQVPFLYPNHSLLSHRHYISSHVLENYAPIRETYQKLLLSKSNCIDGHKYLMQFRRPETKTIYQYNVMSDNEGKNERKRYNKILKMARFLASLIRSAVIEIKLRKKAKTDYTLRYNFNLYKNLPSIMLQRKWLSVWRKLDMALQSHFQKDSTPEDYVFLTLHLQPEASTSVLSPFFVNEWAVMDGISRALPLGWQLVVKPNPLMIGTEPVSFYRRIQSIPNVQLTTPYADTQKLIKNAKAVVAITGTSGFEAALWGKRVILFSDKPIWSMINSVTVCTDFTKLHSLFKEVENYKEDDHDLAAYLQAVHDHSFPLESNYLWKGPYDLSNPGYREAIDEIARQFVKTYQTYREGHTIANFDASVKKS